MPRTKTRQLRDVDRDAPRLVAGEQVRFFPMATAITQPKPTHLPLRKANGETLMDIAKIYNVSHMTISRLS